MKKIIVTLLCAVMVLSSTSCNKEIKIKPKTTNTERSNFGYMWELIPELPKNFPKLSDYVTFASFDAEYRTVHIEWCTTNVTSVQGMVRQIEKWAVSASHVEESDDDHTTCYFVNKQVDDSVLNVALYHFSQNTGEYDEETNTWQSQLVAEIIYSDIPTDDNTYQLSMTYNGDGFSIVNSYKFNGTLCNGLSANILFDTQESFEKNKQEIIDKYKARYPTVEVVENNLLVNITDEQTILYEQLTKADIIVEMQGLGFKR